MKFNPQSVLYFSFALVPLEKKHIFSLTEELYPWFEKKYKSLRI